MAAGRQISRKSYSSRSQEETLSYNYRFNQRTSVHDHDHRRHRYADRDLGRGYRSPFSQQVRNESDAVSGNEGFTKKRKFSPIVWDRAEKQVKVTSKNRIPPTNPVITESSPPKSLNVKLNDIVPVTKIEISPVESLVSNLSDDVNVSRASSSISTKTPEEHYQDQDQDQDQDPDHEDGEYVQERNLSNSKWAFKDSPQIPPNSNNSSPESGELEQDPIEAIEETSCLSAEEDQHSQHSDHLNDEEEDDYKTESPIPIRMIPSCRNVFEYERLGKISEGTYGIVYKAREKKTGEIVALKKIKMGKEREGFPTTALREIQILGCNQHPSIVKMKEVVMDDFNGVYMVMEYINHELKSYMEKTKQPFSQSEVKRLMLDLLHGLTFLHENCVIHRDLKTSNLLLTNEGELKICDFGMARQYGTPVKPYTSLVVTLWYRAPELLLGMKNYGTGVDMWSVGCIMAELLSKKPLFDGNKEVEQIGKIFGMLGTPSESVWPGYSKLPGVKPSFVKGNGSGLRKRFPAATFTGSPVLTELGFDLLTRFLTYDPAKRISAEEALNHGWFRESPLPAENVRMCK